MRSPEGGRRRDVIRALEGPEVSSSLSPLPIDEVLPRILDAVGHAGACVVTAPPGSGKTTRVPGALLDAGLVGDDRLIVLQPRRVAARLAARWVAEERGSPLGGEVGYRVRFEKRVGPDTRLEFVTEGLLLRRIQADPFLEGVGGVVLDELHERSLDLDLSLALLAELRRELRPELKLVVMSATLDAQPVAKFLGGCPIVEAQGRGFPVQVDYAGEVPPEGVTGALSRALRKESGEGHVLVFLPGVREIEDAQAALSGLEGSRVLPLHGRLRVEQQAAALAPSRTRKVVLATNIAETSVTLDGVGLVIDSGLARVPRFDLNLGLDRLERVYVSAASAEQRAGRAGRTGPGRCLRLWSPHQQQRLRPYEAPEVQRADLAGACLQLFAWGTTPEAFAWFERPPEAALQRARALLERLGALSQGQLTERGRALSRLPVAPRLGAVVLAGHRLGCLESAATLAALASEPDPFEDVSLGLHERLRRVAQGRAPRRAALARVQRVADQLRRVARDALGEPAFIDITEDEALARAGMAGFPDRVGQRRSEQGERVRLASGSGARLLAPEQLGTHPLLLAVVLQAPPKGAGREPLVRLAVPLEPEWLSPTRTRCLDFDPEREAVDQRVELRLGALVLEVQPDPEPAEPAEVARLLAEAAQADPGRALGLDERARGWLARLRFLDAQMPELELPRFEDLGPLLPELCLGRRSFAELRALDLVAELAGRLSWPQRQALDTHAPAHWRLPTGREVALRYEEGRPPVLSARIQQLFGLTETPRVARGRVALQVELLAPNHRPAQLTQDLASFWANTYPEVRKDLRGRYPKHAWPEDPLQALPEDRPRRRR
ncbi:MAG: ATP-dependent helicase HrpB [Alphaproteobacteria bacterium]|nr:ATP-dependent helicase HrpB [Alphaproteobacteria bacterium]MCB9792017.1 ATP-dependent helicase HrpB [Alphaproteobacteria bacterium]